MFHGVQASRTSSSFFSGAKLCFMSTGSSIVKHLRAGKSSLMAGTRKTLIENYQRKNEIKSCRMFIDASLMCWKKLAAMLKKLRNMPWLSSKNSQTLQSNFSYKVMRILKTKMTIMSLCPTMTSYYFWKQWVRHRMIRKVKNPSKVKICKKSSCGTWLDGIERQQRGDFSLSLVLST